MARNCFTGSTRPKANTKAALCWYMAHLAAARACTPWPLRCLLLALNKLSIHYWNHLPVTRFSLSEEAKKYLTPDYDFNLNTNFAASQDYQQDLLNAKGKVSISRVTSWASCVITGMPSLVTWVMKSAMGICAMRAPRASDKPPSRNKAVASAARAPGSAKSFPDCRPIITASGLICSCPLI